MSARLGDSRFWNSLWTEYPLAPSVALCRTPELEYASTLNINTRVLDHCCGDGRFAALAWSGRKLNAGCDIDRNSISQASAKNIYNQLTVCDVSHFLPFENESFDLVFNNSALEHVADLDSTLSEVARVLPLQGIFAFNVLNHRYFEWWNMGNQARISYRRWQPFFHALSLHEWEERLSSAGFLITEVKGYLDKYASRELAFLDHLFSGVYLANQHSHFVSFYRRFPILMQKFWRWRLASLTWQTEADAGAGFFIKTIHSNA